MGGIRHMYVQVSDVKKSYGEGGSYIQVLKGVTVGMREGKHVRNTGNQWFR